MIVTEDPRPDAQPDAEDLTLNIEWSVEVIETYRKTIRFNDLPEVLQTWMRNGWSFEVLTATGNYNDGEPFTYEQLIEASDAIDELLVEHEEGPNNEVVADRTLDKAAVQ